MTCDLCRPRDECERARRWGPRLVRYCERPVALEVAISPQVPTFEAGESLRRHHDATEGLTALDIRVRSGGLGERERAVDLDAQLAARDPLE
jgi:hypothetical protein